MKKKRILNLVIFWCLFTFIFSTISCDMLSNGKAEDEESGIDYESYSDCALIVKNNAQENMVVFKGKPSANQLLGGVRAGSKTKLKKNHNYFTETTDYVAYIVTEENYNTYKNDLKKLDNLIYCNFYTIYNKDTKEPCEEEISSVPKGNLGFTINNSTEYNFEINCTQIIDETDISDFTIGYLKAGDLGYFALEEANYKIKPVIKKFSSRNGEIITIPVKYPQNYPEKEKQGKPVSIILDLNHESGKKVIPLADMLADGELGFNYDCAYIEITNNGKEAFSLYKAEYNSAEKTSSGRTSMNPGDTLLFTIPMGSSVESNEVIYNKDETVTSYFINNYNDVKRYLHTDVSKIKYKAGYVYTYSIQYVDKIGGGTIVSAPNTEIIEENGIRIGVPEGKQIDLSKL